MKDVYCLSGESESELQAQLHVESGGAESLRDPAMPAPTGQ